MLSAVVLKTAAGQAAALILVLPLLIAAVRLCTFAKRLLFAGAIVEVRDRLIPPNSQQRTWVSNQIVT